VLSHAVSRIDYIWAMISAVLGMSPEGKDAVELSVIRIKGNIVGVLVGVLFLLVALENPVNIIAGLSKTSRRGRGFSLTRSHWSKKASAITTSKVCWPMPSEIRWVSAKWIFRGLTGR